MHIFLILVFLVGCGSELMEQPIPPLNCEMGVPFEGECVECTAKDFSACKGFEPICRNNTCDKCQSNADCNNGVCFTDGSCSTAQNTAYVSKTGFGSVCSDKEPCALMEDALATQRPYIVVRGSISSNTRIIDREVTIIGESEESTITALVPYSPVIFAEGEAAKVYIKNLGISSSYGTSCIYAQLNSLVHISNSKILSCQDGVAVYFAKAEIYDSEIFRNTEIGAGAFASSLKIERSHLYLNGLRAIDTADSTITVKHSLIDINGGTQSLDSVVKISTATLESFFQFNTIAFNFSASQTKAVAIECPSNVTMLMDNNIIVYNIAFFSDNPFKRQTSASCFPHFSLISDYEGEIKTPGANNIYVPNPTVLTNLFVNVEGEFKSYDYHLKMGAQAIDAADPHSTESIDFDRNPRMGRRDIGAFEFHP